MSGRANLTTAGAIQRVALELFDKHGFEETRIEEIAEAAGIGRRTFFRYFASKNDIPFGDMDPFVEALDGWLSNAPEEMPLLEAIATAVVRFNTAHTDGLEAHRQRMSLIHRTPALQAHRTLRSAQWQQVIARFAARRLGAPVDSLGPQFIGQVAISATVASYDVWLNDTHTDLDTLLRGSFDLIRLAPGVEPEPGASLPKARRNGRARAPR